MKYLSWSSMNSLSFTKSSLDLSDRNSLFGPYSCIEGMEDYLFLVSI
jgi:hypothetical protein